MHELSVAMSIVETALQYASSNNAIEIKEVELQIGLWAGIEFSSLDIALEAAVKDTLMAHTIVKIHKVVPTALCNDCGKEFEKKQLFSECIYCHSFNCKLIKGKELRIQSILIEKN